jgi:exosortase H (IPTLxxWG-CTERM-specific)
LTRKPQDTRSESRRADGRNWLVIRFVLSTLVGVVLFFFVTRLPLVSKHAIYPYTEFITTSSRLALRLIGHDVHGEGLFISGSQFGVHVQNICNGLEVTGIYLAAVLAFPASWRSKLAGLALGYPMIFVFNVSRIVVLYILGLNNPDVFETVHRYYAQALTIILTLSIWVLWVAKFTEYGTKESHRVSS